MTTESLLREAVELQRKHYGDATGLHLAMIGWAERASPLIAELGQEVGAVAWQKSFTVEMDNHHPHPYGIAVITDTDGRQSVYSHGEDQVLWHLLNALAREGEA